MLEQLHAADLNIIIVPAPVPEKMRIPGVYHRVEHSIKLSPWGIADDKGVTEEEFTHAADHWLGSSSDPMGRNFSEGESRVRALKSKAMAWKAAFDKPDNQIDAYAEQNPRERLTEAVKHYLRDSKALHDVFPEAHNMAKEWLSEDFWKEAAGQ